MTRNGNTRRPHGAPARGVPARGGLAVLPMRPTDRGQRVLVVDDDEYIRHLLASALRFAGFIIEVCADGRTALERINEFDPDLVLLDVMMPKLDGIEVCRRVRAAGIETPVIFLTARDAPEDKVSGLTQGGDDYVTKPFDLDELVARIDAVLKRTTARPETVARRHEYAGLVLDEDAHRVWSDSELIPLSPTEFRMLRYLLMNADRVVTKSQILSQVWGFDYAGDPGIVETYIFYLRRKLGDAGPRLIHTVRGVGYSLRVE
jgi:two-component system OmpR family response regulator